MDTKIKIVYKYKCANFFLCTKVLTSILSKPLSAVEISISDQCDTQLHLATQNRQSKNKQTNKGRNMNCM